MELAIDDPIKRAQQYAVNQNQFQAPQAPLSQNPGVGTQMANMAKNRAMEGALNAGQKGITEGITSALAPSAGATKAAALASNPATMGMGGAEVALAGQTLAPTAGAGMAALGTAMPYVGAGLLAGKVLGLFNEGGMVGPLSTQYHADGNKIDRNKKYSEDQQIANYREMMKQQAYNKLITGQNPNTNLDSLGAFQAAATSDPIMSKIYDVGKAPRDNIVFKMTPGFDVYTRPDKRGYLAQDTIMNPNSEGQLNPKNYYEQGGQIGMSKEQAMALMNNQPDPDQLYNEIVAESMIGKTQQGQVIPFTPKSMPTVNQMPQYQTMPPTMPLVGPLSVDSMGADTTYSDEMYKPINT